MKSCTRDSRYAVLNLLVIVIGVVLQSWALAAHSSTGFFGFLHLSKHSLTSVMVRFIGFTERGLQKKTNLPRQSSERINLRMVIVLRSGHREVIRYGSGHKLIF